MKNKKNLFIALGFVIALFGCQKDQTENRDYYYTLGVIRIASDSTIINTDNGLRLYVTNPDKVGNSITDSNRISAYFYLDDNTTLPTGIDHIIDLDYMEKILTKSIVVYTPENDTLGNDPIYLRALGITGNYLNLGFEFTAYNTVHDINLARQAGEITSDTVDLEVRHNRKGDLESGLVSAFVSFDLSPIKSAAPDSVFVRVLINDYSDSTYTTILKYKY